MKKHLIILYILFAFLYIIFSKAFTYSWILKLIPVVFLLFAILKSENFDKKRSVFYALLFSLGGDFFLGIDSEQYFIYGLSSFLIAHLFYMYSLRPLKFELNWKIIFYLLYTIVILAIMAPSLGKLAYPVIIYIIILLFMAVSAVLSTKSNLFLVLGSACFVLSDSIIGLNKFVLTIPHSLIFIMSTYYPAQFFIIKGFLKK